MKKITEIIIHVLYGVFAFVVIFLFVYFFGHSTLQAIVKGDAELALSYATWIDHFFPKIPFWYPLSGAGESIVLGYHLLSIYVVVAFRHLAGISLDKSFILFQFIPLVLAPIAIYLYSSLRLKNQTIGLIAAVFYTLMPLSWTWITDWGFYAESFSLPFFTIGFLCFDWYLDEYFSDSSSRKTKIGLLLFATFFTLTVMSHAATGVALIFSSAAFGIIYSIFKKESGLQSVRKGITAIFLGVIFALVLSSFFLLPFIRYSAIANKEGLNNVNPQLLVPNPPKMFFQITPIESGGYESDSSYIYHNMSIPILIWALAVLGAVVAILKSRKVFALFLVATIGTILIVYPGVDAFVINNLPSLAVIFDKRSWVAPISTLTPIVAAYFLYEVANAIYFPILLAAKKIRKGIVSYSILKGHDLLVSGTAIILAAVAGYLFRNVSIADQYKGILVNYGPNSYTDVYNIWRVPFNTCGSYITFSGKEVESCIPCGNLNISKKDLQSCKSFSEEIHLSNWPRVSIPSAVPQDTTEAKMYGQLPQSSNGLYRIDISPNLGGLSKDMGLYSNASQVNSYTYQLSLIHSMWGYMQSVMYFTSINNQPSVVNELARLFGINKVFLFDKSDVYQKYQEAGWKNTFGTGSGSTSNNWEVWDNPNPTQLASLLVEPRVLVIGNSKLGVYDNIFRLSIQGALPFEKGILFEGTKNIDDYTPSELKQFNLIVLDGYSYANKSNAFSILDSYVRSGGSLYIDTGWQYVDEDYQIQGAPGFFPAGSLKWTDIGKASAFSVVATDIAGNVDAGKISPLIWSGVPWGISSVGSLSNLRSWAKPVLVSGNTPLITAGQYGRGKVVWSGFNLVAHILANKNDEEIKLLGDLWNYLLPTGSSEGVPLNISRDNPDIVKIQSKGSTDQSATLYFRESMYPDWSAKLLSQGMESDLKIYSAGSGFMGMLLPRVSNGDQVILSFKPGFDVTFGKILSILALIVLLIQFTPLGASLSRAVKNKDGISSGLKNKMKKIVNSEEKDY